MHSKAPPAELIEQVSTVPRRSGLGGLLWSFFLCSPVAVLALLMAIDALARWWPTPANTPVFATVFELRVQLVVATVCAALLLALPLLSGCLEARAWCFARGTRRVRIIFLSLAITSSQSLAVVRCVLPWEDPYDGSGSPLAVLLGLCMYGLMSGAFVTLPGCAVLWRLLAHRMVTGRGHDVDKPRNLAKSVTVE